MIQKSLIYLKINSILLKIVIDSEEKYVSQRIGYSGDIQTTKEVILSNYSNPDLQQCLSFTTKRTIYEYRSKMPKGRTKRNLLDTNLLLFHDFVIFQDGDPFLVTELRGDPSQLPNHVGRCSRMTIFEGIFRYHRDVYDKMYDMKINPSPTSKVYKSDWNAWDHLPEQFHTNEKEHQLILRFQGRLFLGDRLKKDSEKYMKALIVQAEDE